MPDEKYSLAIHMIQEHRVCQRQACKAVSLPRRSTQWYKTKYKVDEVLTDQLQQLIYKHQVIGFCKNNYCIGRKDFACNHKKALTFVHRYEIQYPQALP